MHAGRGGANSADRLASPSPAYVHQPAALPAAFGGRRGVRRIIFWDFTSGKVESRQ